MERRRKKNMLFVCRPISCPTGCLRPHCASLPADAPHQCTLRLTEFPFNALWPLRTYRGLYFFPPLTHGHTDSSRPLNEEIELLISDGLVTYVAADSPHWRFPSSVSCVLHLSICVRPQPEIKCVEFDDRCGHHPPTVYSLQYIQEPHVHRSKPIKTTTLRMLWEHCNSNWNRTLAGLSCEGHHRPLIICSRMSLSMYSNTEKTLQHKITISCLTGTDLCSPWRELQTLRGASKLTNAPLRAKWVIPGRHLDQTFPRSQVAL